MSSAALSVSHTLAREAQLLYSSTAFEGHLFSWLICCVPLQTVEMKPTRKGTQLLCFVLIKISFEVDRICFH